LLPRFERYLDVVVVRTGYHLDTTRLNLEVGFERLAEPLLAGGALGEETFRKILAELEREVAAAPTVDQVVIAYRRAVTELEHVLAEPALARRELDLRRSIEFINERLGQPLRRADAARAGGFAPDYFSRLFKKREHTTFERYVERLRIERAQQLLMRTGLGIEAVARLCGFGSGSYFHRVFRRTQGCTPMEYRRRVMPKPSA
jgi:transcriptional regulator GlxA family with amidase domain